MKKLFIISALIFLFGCSTPTDSPSIAPTEPAVLKSIHVSVYSTEHPKKPQPMLIQVISEPNELNEYDSKLMMRKLVELPANEVTDLYYLQLECVRHGVSEYKDFLYAKGAGGKVYVKEFTMGPKYNFDIYNQSSKESLLEAIGNKEWYILASQLPI